MHQDITPLCAADIQDQLKKRFAYLSGECRLPGSVGAGSAWWVVGLPWILVLHDLVGPV